MKEMISIEKEAIDEMYERLTNYKKIVAEAANYLRKYPKDSDEQYYANHLDYLVYCGLDEITDYLETELELFECTK